MLKLRKRIVLKKWTENGLFIRDVRETEKELINKNLEQFLYDIIDDYEDTFMDGVGGYYDTEEHVHYMIQFLVDDLPDRYKDSDSIYSESWKDYHSDLKKLLDEGWDYIEVS